MKIPLLSDTRRTISTDYGVLKEDEGIAYRWAAIMELHKALCPLVYEPISKSFCVRGHNRLPSFHVHRLF